MTKPSDDLAKGAAHLELQVNGLDYVCLEWRPQADSGSQASKGLVVACHGFPDHAPSFRFLGPALAQQGYRVVAPYLRGYAPTALGEGPYHPVAVAQDVVALVDTIQEEGEPLHLVGHDWGAAITYFVSAALGNRVRKIATMAVPHGGGFGEALVSNPEQQRRSWYMFFFQLPVAEAAVAHNDFAFIDRLRAEWSPGLEEDAEDLAALKRMFATEGVLTAALGYYRDLFNPPAFSKELAQFAATSAGQIHSPCLYLHGDQDGCIGFEIADKMPGAFSGELEIERIDGVGHFLHLESPETINARIVDWFER